MEIFIFQNLFINMVSYDSMNTEKELELLAYEKT